MQTRARLSDDQAWCENRKITTRAVSVPQSSTACRRSSTPTHHDFAGALATGESYCLAHHLSVGEDGVRTIMIASIRYLDEFVRQDGVWLFAERRLMVDWTETRPSAS